MNDDTLDITALWRHADQTDTRAGWMQLAGVFTQRSLAALDLADVTTAREGADLVYQCIARSTICQETPQCTRMHTLARHVDNLRMLVEGDPLQARVLQDLDALGAIAQEAASLPAQCMLGMLADAAGKLLAAYDDGCIAAADMDHDGLAVMFDHLAAALGEPHGPMATGVSRTPYHQAIQEFEGAN